MQIIVQKYGGTSLGSIERITRVAENIAHALTNKQIGLVVVVSAMAGQTDSLFSLAGEIGKNLPNREMDNLVATGEQVSVSLLTIALKNKGVDAKGFCGWQIPIVTTDDFSGARIKSIAKSKILTELSRHPVIVIAGFQGVNEMGDITTLGRGGSDTSAVAIAVSLNALECQIFTDVNGVYNADPNKITSAKRIDKINGKIMLEMASLGAKVLHVRSCELAYRYRLNIRVLSSFAPQDQGSLVMNNGELEHYPVISISVEEQQTLIILDKQEQDIQLNALIARLYGVCNLDMLNVLDNQRVSFSISYTNYDRINQLLTASKIHFLVTNNLTKLSIIGSGFRSNNTLNQTIWQLLEEVEVFSFAHSELSMSILVHSSEVTKVRNKLAQLL
jgi:aspartate kinase